MATEKIMNATAPPLAELSAIKGKDQETMAAMNQAAKTDPKIAKRVHLFRYRVPEEFYDLEKDPVLTNNAVWPCRPTPFSWQALTRIPAGRTLAYGELAARLDSGARAVGNACRASGSTGQSSRVPRPRQVHLHVR